MKGLRSKNVLAIIGLAIIVLPFLGLPLLIKNILLVVLGLGIMAVALSHHRIAAAETTELSVTVEPMPAVYHEPLPQTYVEPPMPAAPMVDSLIPSPLKPKTVRRRRTKTTSLDSIEGNGHIV